MHYSFDKIYLNSFYPKGPIVDNPKVYSLGAMYNIMELGKKTLKDFPHLYCGTDTDSISNIIHD